MGHNLKHTRTYLSSAWLLLVHQVLIVTYLLVHHDCYLLNLNPNHMAKWNFFDIVNSIILNIYIYIHIYVHTNKKENKQKNIYMKTKYKISLQWSTTFFFKKFWPSYILDLPETFVQSISWGICARVLCFNVKRNHCTLKHWTLAQICHYTLFIKFLARSKMYQAQNFLYKNLVFHWRKIWYFVFTYIFC